MKRILLVAGLVILSSVCFAQKVQLSRDRLPTPSVTQADYYEEYSFAEADEGEIHYTEIQGINGWKYHHVGYWTRADIQNRINYDMQRSDMRQRSAEYMGRMLRAGADKRIFIIDTSGKNSPYGWLFIKINENQYISFFTGT